MKHDFEFQATLSDTEGADVAVTVEAVYHPGQKASGPHGERHTQPPVPASIEITGVRLADGDEYVTTVSELDDLTDEAWNHLPSEEE